MDSVTTGKVNRLSFQVNPSGNGITDINNLSAGLFDNTTMPTYLTIANQKVSVSTAHATLTIQTKLKARYIFGPYAKLKFNLIANKTLENGFLMGFGKIGSNKRLMIGYEPSSSYNAIVAYYNDGTNYNFYNLLLDTNSPNGSYNYTCELVKGIDGKVTLYLNGQAYDANTIFAQTIAFDFDSIHMQAKPRTVGDLATDISFSTSLTAKSKYELSGTKLLSDQGKRPGRNLHIYHFGGLGNDWCFVRTPPNYDPDGKPHPIVICNHGNGWTMGGTEAMANFSDKTQFGVDTQNSNAYMDTANSLYYKYSSPLIETLLNSGYVVAGCQNYADALYGNENCRRACVDFINHMRQSYNVQQQVYMIGASNGAMTSLNAVHVLGAGAVKAMVLLYPLVNLEWQYFNYSAHKAGIEAAYGLAANVDATTFKAATISHDPMSYGVYNVSGTNYKLIPYPPIKFWASAGDTVVNMTNHAQALYNLITTSRIGKAEIVTATGNHGDYTHFDPAAVLAWFEKFK